MRLPKASDALLLDATRPYFLWWLDMTVGDLRRELASAEAATQGYYQAALLREANSRDAWLYRTPSEVKNNWPNVARHLGKARSKWMYILCIEETNGQDTLRDDRMTGQ
jgi:hypothetical protein